MFDPGQGHVYERVTDYPRFREPQKVPQNAFEPLFPADPA